MELRPQGLISTNGGPGIRFLGKASRIPKADLPGYYLQLAKEVPLWFKNLPAYKDVRSREVVLSSAAPARRIGDLLPKIQVGLWAAYRKAQGQNYRKGPQ